MKHFSIVRCAINYTTHLSALRLLSKSLYPPSPNSEFRDPRPSMWCIWILSIPFHRFLSQWSVAHGQIAIPIESRWFSPISVVSWRHWSILACQLLSTIPRLNFSFSRTFWSVYLVRHRRCFQSSTIISRISPPTRIEPYASVCSKRVCCLDQLSACSPVAFFLSCWNSRWFSCWLLVCIWSTLCISSSMSTKWFNWKKRSRRGKISIRVYAFGRISEHHSECSSNRETASNGNFFSWPYWVCWAVCKLIEKRREWRSLNRKISFLSSVRCSLTSIGKYFSSNAFAIRFIDFGHEAIRTFFLSRWIIDCLSLFETIAISLFTTSLRGLPWAESLRSWRGPISFSATATVSISSEWYGMCHSRCLIEMCQ